MKRVLLLIAFIGFLLSAQAATVDTVWVESKAMKQSFKCVVITPTKTVNQAKRFPVTYLLHGYSGWYSNWIIRMPELMQEADHYQMMIVCPEGKNSWYIDSPINDSMRWETYIAKEVPAFIDSHYPTIASRNARAITGLSMGGHGGLYLGIKQASIFGACGSMSGGVDIGFRKTSWELQQLLGDSATYPNHWKDYSAHYLVENYKADSSAMIIDCGTEDFFFGINEKLHQKLLDLKIPHEYITRPGKHDWNYWRNAVRFQLLFFDRYFSKTRN
ncbi:MAG: alpha/beta hydrolase [Chitinophagaceae bacterium]